MGKVVKLKSADCVKAIIEWIGQNHTLWPDAPDLADNMAHAKANNHTCHQTLKNAMVKSNWKRRSCMTLKNKQVVRAFDNLYTPFDHFGDYEYAVIVSDGDTVIDIHWSSEKDYKAKYDAPILTCLGVLV